MDLTVRENASGGERAGGVSPRQVRTRFEDGLVLVLWQASKSSWLGQLLLPDGQGEEEDDGGPDAHARAHEVEAGAQEACRAIQVASNYGACK